MFRKQNKLYVNENYNNCHKLKTTCTLFIYTKRKLEKHFYTRCQTLVKKQDNYRYFFIYKKQDTLRYTIFHDNFKVGI